MPASHGQASAPSLPRYIWPSLKVVRATCEKLSLWKDYFSIFSQQRILMYLNILATLLIGAAIA